MFREMDLLVSFSFGIMTGVGLAAAVAYYKVRKFVDPRSILSLVKSHTPKLIRFSNANVVEYEYCGTTHHALIPYQPNNVISHGIVQYSIVFDDDGKVKTEFMPGQWIAGRFKDYGIKRLVARPVPIDGTECSPVEVFNSSVDDGEQEIWPAVEKALQSSDECCCCTAGGGTTTDGDSTDGDSTDGDEQTAELERQFVNLQRVALEELGRILQGEIMSKEKSE